MTNFLELLIYSTNTLDGKRDSAIGMKNLQYKIAYQKLVKSKGKTEEITLKDE